MKARSDKPYTSEELQGVLPDWPDRGVECPKCGAVIPEFVALKDDDRFRIRSLIIGGQRLMAMREIESLTGAPTRWAKIWVTHSGRADSFGTTAPCPFCGEPLKTALAKQCQHCFMDWHDAKNPKHLELLRIK